MKLKKPFNQNRNIFQSVVGASRYRLLSIFMAALIFCGMNSQLLAAASLNLGANIDANNNASASGDKFNSESFLKASNPNADDHQHWTWGEEIRAVILGVALLGGAVAGGYKCYADRNARIAGSETQERLKNDTSASDDQRANSGYWSSWSRGFGTSRAADSTIVDGSSTEESSSGNEVVPGWREKSAALLASLGQEAYNLATLKSCLPAAKPVEASSEKLFEERFLEAFKDHSKKQFADYKAQRSWGQFVGDLVTFKSHDLASPLTVMQQRTQLLANIVKKEPSQHTALEKWVLEGNQQTYNEREGAIAALNTASRIEEMLAVLDPEVVPSLNELMGTPGRNYEENLHLLYFVAKNPEIHPKHIEAMKVLFSQLSSQKEAPTSNDTMIVLSSQFSSQKEAPTSNDTMIVSQEGSTVSSKKEIRENGQGALGENFRNAIEGRWTEDMKAIKIVQQGQSNGSVLSPTEIVSQEKKTGWFR